MRLCIVTKRRGRATTISDVCEETYVRSRGGRTERRRRNAGGTICGIGSESIQDARKAANRCLRGIETVDLDKDCLPKIGCARDRPREGRERGHASPGRCAKARSRFRASALAFACMRTRRQTATSVCEWRIVTKTRKSEKAVRVPHRSFKPCALARAPHTNTHPARGARRRRTGHTLTTRGYLFSS